MRFGNVLEKCLKMLNLEFGASDCSTGKDLFTCLKNVSDRDYELCRSVWEKVFCSTFLYKVDSSDVVLDIGSYYS